MNDYKTRVRRVWIVWTIALTLAVIFFLVLPLLKAWSVF